MTWVHPGVTRDPPAGNPRWEALLAPDPGTEARVRVRVSMNTGWSQVNPGISIITSQMYRNKYCIRLLQSSSTSIISHCGPDRPVFELVAVPSPVPPPSALFFRFVAFSNISITSPIPGKSTGDLAHDPTVTFARNVLFEVRC